MSRLLLVAVAAALALLAVASPMLLRVRADHPAEDMWQQPVLVETLSSSLSSSASAEFDVRSLLAVNAQVDASSLTEAQAEAYHAALVQQTVTAEGKSRAQLQAEIEARAPTMWAEFKARFSVRYSSVAEEAKRYATFVANLARVAINNAKAALSQLPARLKVVHSHLVAYADRTADEFRAMLGAKFGRNKSLPVAAPAPRGVLRKAGQAVASFLETEVTLDDAVDVDAETEAETEVEAEAEAELDAELDAEADAEVEAEAEAEAEAESESELAAAPTLPKKGQMCEMNGICLTGTRCPSSSYIKGTGACAAGLTCCVLPSATPSTPAPKPTPAPAPAAPAAPVKTQAAKASGKTSAPIDSDFRSDSSPIKNQGQCGSCWAFSAVSALESAYRLKTGAAVPVLSPQQMVDCVPGSGSDKCGGGFPEEGLEWAANNGGSLTEAVYPYKATGGTCAKPTGSKVNVKPKGVKASIKPCYSAPCKQDESELGHQLSAVGPITAGVDASDLQFYRSGVIEPSATGCSSNPDALNHAIVIEGLGTDKSSGKRFWIVRNSWSTNWGEKGRFRLAFGSNTCGIASIPTHVEM